MRLHVCFWLLGAVCCLLLLLKLLFVPGSGAAPSAAVQYLPATNIDCEDCHHLKTDPNIYGHYAGVHCPCLQRTMVEPAKPFTLPVM
jgi:hypothetical protein